MKNSTKISLFILFIVAGLTHNESINARGGGEHASNGNSTHNVSGGGQRHNGGDHNRYRSGHNGYHEGYYGNGYNDIIIDDVIDEPYYDNGDVVSDIAEDVGLATGGYRGHHRRFRR